MSNVPRSFSDSVPAFNAYPLPPELLNAIPFELSVLDEIISRTSLGETSFIAVFKAYEEVLKERGLNVGSEV
ncbi:hypothetical protein BDV98DRAFT_571944, partial [Pterulicium gracile]